MRIVGWALGAASLLNLVQDIGYVSVVGKLKMWLDAYAFFVRRVGDFLFGWIHLGWLSISREEHHVLVLATIFSAAVLRAQYYKERSRGADSFLAHGGAIALAIYWFAFPLVPALFLPDSWGLGGALLGLLFALGVALTIGSSDTLAAGVLVRKELLGMIGLFLVLVALNYSLFHVTGG